MAKQDLTMHVDMLIKAVTALAAKQPAISAELSKLTQAYPLVSEKQMEAFKARMAKKIEKNQAAAEKQAAKATKEMDKQEKKAAKKDKKAVKKVMKKVKKQEKKVAKKTAKSSEHEQAPAI